jgi:hypothetical protein
VLAWVFATLLTQLARAASPPPVSSAPASGPTAEARPPPAADARDPASSAADPIVPAVCLPTGDGYLRARLAGTVEARVDWRNAGTSCEGEPRDMPPGVRLSFKRVPHEGPDLLFVFGLTGVHEGQSGRELGTNLTIIVQGTDRIYGTLGDSRCTVDTLTQRRLAHGRRYRVEARGFCTQPAHAIRGNGDVLVSTFEFAGIVDYDVPEADTPFPAAGSSLQSPKK